MMQGAVVHGELTPLGLHMCGNQGLPAGVRQGMHVHSQHGVSAIDEAQSVSLERHVSG